MLPVADLEIIQGRGRIKMYPILNLFVFNRAVHYCLYKYITQGSNIRVLFPLNPPLCANQIHTRFYIFLPF